MHSSPLTLWLLAAFGTSTVHTANAGVVPPERCAQLFVGGYAYCVAKTGALCSPSAYGACPGPQPNLTFGSTCTKNVVTGLYACNALSTSLESGSLGSSSADGPPCVLDQTIPALESCVFPTSDGWTSISVVGMDSYCTRANAAGYCSANIRNGACPVAQPGLPRGSECQLLDNGVYGCVARTSCVTAPTMAPVVPCIALPPIKLAPK
ncbi:hypothetical protein SDRG_07936 [Saprolegnia diclina VS20]|uniref:Uncharacterized protein n=1 Tax=Saprolegnia diclina (strain VS20) TaxID=1156394 RepID=T0Q9P0_SAPDV|nr:hypothetical protein SDRG_07936 [Saprolegnia diclina VS20]EQC34614.1 hypothetical protein SDRG_07936 [Saprolegnia diclina VS20]|eukprot:XP_008612020.1 hypothetical protein SDRG_07936 [Saprolegnia diclina VS20]